MALQVIPTLVAINTSGSTQDVRIAALTETPKFIIVNLVNAINGAHSAGACISVGYAGGDGAGGINNRCSGVSCEDDITTSDTYRFQSELRCGVVLDETNGTEDGAISVTAFLADVGAGAGITLSLDNLPSAAFMAEIIMFGGSDIEETYVDHHDDLGNGTSPVTIPCLDSGGSNFVADTAFLSHIGSNTIITGSDIQSFAVFSFGCWDRLDASQRFIAFGSNNAQGNALAGNYSDANNATGQAHFSGPAWLGSAATHANGFSIDPSVSAGSDIFCYGAIKWASGSIPAVEIIEASLPATDIDWVETGFTEQPDFALTAFSAAPTNGTIINSGQDMCVAILAHADGIVHSVGIAEEDGAAQMINSAWAKTSCYIGDPDDGTGALTDGAQDDWSGGGWDYGLAAGSHDSIARKGWSIGITAQVSALEVADSVLSLTADNVVLAVDNSLTVADALLSQSADNIALQDTATGALIANSLTNLTGGDPGLAGRSNTLHWENTSAPGGPRIDGLIPQGDGDATGDHYIAKDIFNPTYGPEVETRPDARPDCYFDDVNNEVHIVGFHGTTTQYWRLGYDAGTDAYTLEVTAETVTGITIANTGWVGGITLTPNGNLWVFSLTNAGLLMNMRTHDGAWNGTATNLDNSIVGGMCCATWQVIGGDNNVWVFCAENDGAAAPHEWHVYYIDEDHGTPFSAGSWTGWLTGWTKSDMDGGGSDNHCCCVKIGEFVYVVVKTDSTTVGETLVGLWVFDPGGTVTAINGLDDYSATGSNNRSRPSIAADSNGRIYVFWNTEQGSDLVGSFIYSDDFGSTWSTEAPMFTESGNSFTGLRTMQSDHMHLGSVPVVAERIVGGSSLPGDDLYYSILTVTPGTPTLVTADALLSQTVDAVALTQANALAVADALLSLTAGAVVLVTDNTLIVADALLTLSADPLTLVSAGTLSVNDALLSQSVDAVALTQAHSLAVADALLSQSVDNVELIAGDSLSVADALLSLTVPGVTLSESATLIVNDALLTLFADQVIFGEIKGRKIGVLIFESRDRTLIVAPSRQNDKIIEIEPG